MQKLHLINSLLKTVYGHVISTPVFNRHNTNS